MGRRRKTHTRELTNLNQPPVIAQWLLRHSISPNIRYGAMGDFEHIYSEIAESDGQRKANVWYWRQAFRSIPFFISDTLIWSLIMLKNYLHVAYRNLYKNKSSSLVNILGLSIAVATSIVAFVFIENQYTMDSFHENADNIFLVENYIERGEDQQLRGDTPIPLGPAMEAAIPQVIRSIRAASGNPTFRAGNNTFQEFIRYVDPEFLDMFTFDLRLGNKSTPIGHNDIVLSDDLATKYFGKQNPMGRELDVIFSDTQTRTFTVSAVAKAFPHKASFSFGALIHFDHLSISNIDQTDWETTTRATFIEVNNPSDVELIAGQMDQFRQQQNAANVNQPIAQFEFANLRALSAESYAVSGDISGGSHPASGIALGMISIFMLLLSCINYMNLAVATASRRLKEIGIRKAVGSTKGQIISQFLSENILMCVFSLGAGFAIAYFLLLPGFNALTAVNGGDITLGEANTFYLWTFLIGILLITGLMSGAYPAFYISSFNPTAIFRGRTKLGGESIFSQSLLTFQFVIAFITMITAVILSQNANYQAQKDWGYESEHLLVLQTDNGGQFDVLRTEISQLAGVSEIVGARHHFARDWSQTSVEVGTDKFGAVRFDVGREFLDTYDVSVISGDGFDGSSMTETDGRVIVNETFATSRGWTVESAIGQTVREDSVSYTIAGVTGDFMYTSFLNPIEPAVLRAIPESDYRYMTIKLAPGSAVQTEEAVQGIWKKLVPDREYTGTFQDTAFQAVFVENTNIKTMFRFISIVALLIACMGLYGIASQKVARRLREISIRKVLGASVPHLAQKVNRSFVIVLIIAAIISTPLGYVAMDGLLNSVYADPIPIGPSGFILSFALVLGTAVLTISSHIRKFVTANPAEVLRSE